VVVGLVAGVLSAVLTGAVYASEDAFERLPIHWMWWPAIGGLIIGIGGFLFPQALGAVTTSLKACCRQLPLRIIVGVLVVKSTIWATVARVGHVRGVLAPLLMMGGALGGLEAHFLPFEGAGFLAADQHGPRILGGNDALASDRRVFALELTHDVDVLLPLLLAVTVAHGFTVLTLRRSILTEK